MMRSLPALFALFSAAVLVATRPTEDPSNNPFTLYHAPRGSPEQFKLVDKTTSITVDFDYFSISHKPKGGYSYGGFYQTSAIEPLFNWISSKNTVWSTATGPEQRCVDATCDSNETCKPAYWCIAELSKEPNLRSGSDWEQCLQKHFPEAVSKSWQCIVILQNNPTPGCVDLDQQFSETDKWRRLGVDEKMLIAWSGGSTNNEGSIYFQGATNETYASALGRQLLNIDNMQCTVKDPCDPDLDCDTIGSWSALEGGFTKKPLPLLWGFYGMTGLTNLNKELVNRYQALDKSKGDLALEAFNIDDYYPKKGQNFGLLNALTGLGGLFAIVGGFVPVTAVAGALGAAGTIASGVAGFTSNAVAAKLDPLEAAGKFSQKVLATYDVLLKAMEDAITMLFNGESIQSSNGSFNITDMLKDGAWASPHNLTDVNELGRQVKTEILSRSINSLWKTFSSNKMWVLFIDLQDGPGTEKCLADISGPPDSKYCADGGVYYTYNFIELGDGLGTVHYPWGADKLENVGLKLQWVTESSAKSYRLMKAKQPDRVFDFDQVAGTSAFLAESFTQENVDLAAQVGRYPGTWTLPVCDASTWGARWNWDYTKNKNPQEGDSTETHPPCLCGPQGSETNAWARAAGMASFETFWHHCTDALEDKTFQWPEGVTEVKLPVNDNGEEYAVRKPS